MTMSTNGINGKLDTDDGLWRLPFDPLRVAGLIDCAENRSSCFNKLLDSSK